MIREYSFLFSFSFALIEVIFDKFFEASLLIDLADLY
jgi:hypothetical protein